jgi:hypothetical protein
MKAHPDYRLRLRQDNYTSVLEGAFKLAIENVATVGKVPDAFADVLINRRFNKRLFYNLSLINRILPLLSEAKVPKKSTFITCCNTLVGLTKKVYDCRHSDNTDALLELILYLKKGCRIMTEELLKIFPSEELDSA